MCAEDYDFDVIKQYDMAVLDVQIYSLNCNGLGDEHKRVAVFDKLNTKYNGIFLFQETHSSQETELKWIRQWGSKHMYFSHGTTNQRGVAIGISKNYDIDIKDIKHDNDGRYIVLVVERYNVSYTIGNIYAPTRNSETDQQIILEAFVKTVDESLVDHCILGGDYNLYLNPNLDKLDDMPDSNDNPGYRNDLLSYLETYNIVDVWRVLNPGVRKFTWHRANKRARLDYLFVSEHLLNVIDKCVIDPGIQSDHSLVSVSFKTNNNNRRGRGFWKFNSSLLQDPEYVAKIKEIIKDSIEKYKTVQDKCVLWELIKLETRTFTIPYCAKKKKESVLTEKC